MAATFRGGLLHRDHGRETGDARRTGKGLMPLDPVSVRPMEGRILELQSTAGNAAVERALQRQASGADEREAGPGRGLQRLAAIQREEAVGVAEPAPTAPPAPGDGDGIRRYGSRGDDVRLLQARLNLAGAGKPPLVLDGIFGRKTQRAVREFQAQHPPVAVDGDAGPDTMAALDRVAPETGQARDLANVNAVFEKGKTHYMAGAYGLAYDEFSKAFEINGDPSLLFNRGNALRLLRGRRNDAIAMYEQFLASNVDADEQRGDARTYIEELRGPGRSGDASLDTAMVYMYNRNGSEAFGAGEYGRAYDEFSMAYEITGDPGMLWNRAQSLRLLGGRGTEAIALYEQFMASLADATEAKANAQGHIADLRGPGRTGDATANAAAADALWKAGQEHYLAERYAQAYDEFTKSYDVDPDPSMLFNRAQALRLAGGRRPEAIALYEKLQGLEIGDEAKATVGRHLAELRGPGKSAKPEATAPTP